MSPLRLFCIETQCQLCYCEKPQLLEDATIIYLPSQVGSIPNHDPLLVQTRISSPINAKSGSQEYLAIVPGTGN